LYNQSEFGNLETYLLEKKYSKKLAADNPLIFIYLLAQLGLKNTVLRAFLSF